VARYQAVIEYDGTAFLGFQRQAVGRTIQAEIETALGRLGWTGRAVLGAGRTDTGVHAAGQVIAFDLDWGHGSADLFNALNANLPPDVAVKTLREAAPDFHPRFAAKARRYRYTIYNLPARSPLAARFAWHVWQPALNLEAMQAASRELLGTHDFAAFGSDPDEGENTVRTVTQAVWTRPDESRLDFDIQADAFLRRMVRSLVGALKQVGAGHLALTEFQALLASRDRTRCPPVAPPQGLCLMEVMY
jgi:tRNA pseudouridine38-40 synthase